MQAVLDQHEVTIVTRLDLLRGAVDAWLFDRGFAMSLTVPALRGVRLGLLPCAFVLSHYLLQLDLNADTTLLNLLGTANLASLVAVCLWAGKREAELGTGWVARLVAGATAGAAGVLASIVVQDGLLLADLRFSITSSVIALQGGSMSGDGFAVVAGRILNLHTVEVTAVVVLVAGVAGVVVAAAGTLLRGVRLTRVVNQA